MRPLPRRRTLFALLVLLILIIFNIAVSAFLIFTVNSASLPKIEIAVTTFTLGTDQATLAYTLTIHNTNDFDLSLQHLTLTLRTTTTDLASIPLANGTIPAHTTTTLTDTKAITLSGNLTGLLTAALTGDIDITFAIIHKTLPLSLTIQASIDDLIDQIHLPTIHIAPTLGTITNTSIALNTTITITNPNAFALGLHDTTLSIGNETNETVTLLPITNGTIPAKANATLYSNGFLAFSILNAQTLTITFTSKASAIIAGTTKTLPLSTAVTLAFPDLGTLLPHTAPIELRLFVDTHRVKGGIQGETNLTVYNPSSLPLYVKDLRIDYYSVLSTGLNYLAYGNLTEHELTPHATTKFTGTIFFSWKILLPHGRPLLPPTRLYASLSANITLTGLTHLALWVRLGDYVDLRPYRLTE